MTDSISRVGQAGTEDAPPMLDIRSVGLQISGIDILSGVSLQVATGELLAIIGPNGAGKTSLVNVVNGLTLPTSGSVMLGERDITTWQPHRRAKAGMARTFQTSNLLLGRTVLENVRLAASAHGLSMRALLRPVRAKDSSFRVAQESLKLVGLEGQSATTAASLSHGERRKLELAVVLAQDPDIILLDEPMAGVNSEDVGDLVTLIRDVHRTQGKTMIMVEHHISVVLDLADRIAVLHHGRLLAHNDPRAIIADPEVQRAYVGEGL